MDAIIKVAAGGSKAPRRAAPTDGYVAYPITLMADSEIITGVTEVPVVVPVEVARYNMAGMPVGASYRGLVIIVMSDGTVRKVLSN